MDNRYLSSLILVLAVLSSSAFAQQTKYEQLKNKFDTAANTLTVSTLLGAYEGRCYYAPSAVSAGANAAVSSNTPLGMVLTTREIPTRTEDEGPLFPSTPYSNYQMAVSYKGELSDVSINDTVTQEDLNQLWENNSSTVSAFEIVNNTATTKMVSNAGSAGSKQVTTAYVRKGSDGFLYAELNSTFAAQNHVKDPFLTCYFWKKLF